MNKQNDIIVKRDGNIIKLTNGFVIEEQPDDGSKYYKRYLAAMRKAKTKNDFSSLEEFRLVRDDGSWYCGCAELWYENNETSCHWCFNDKPAIYG